MNYYEDINIKSQTGESKMKLLMKITISIVILAVNCNAQLNYQPIPSKSRPPGKYVFDHMEIVGLAGSIDQLIMMSTLVIDGTVDKVLPSVRLASDDPMSLETYSRISVNEVIRGELSKDQQSVAIAEPGGNSEGYEVVYQEHPLVKSSERYILFLKPYFERKGFVNNLGMPLYMMVGSWAGKVKVTEKGLVQFLPAAHAALHSLDGLSIETFTTALAERINYIYSPLRLPNRETESRVPQPGVPLPPFGYKKQ
jgi:hypothetical protein